MTAIPMPVIASNAKQSSLRGVTHGIKPLLCILPGRRAALAMTA